MDLYLFIISNDFDIIAAYDDVIPEVTTCVDNPAYCDEGL